MKPEIKAALNVVKTIGKEILHGALFVTVACLIFTGSLGLGAIGGILIAKGIMGLFFAGVAVEGPLFFGAFLGACGGFFPVMHIASEASNYKKQYQTEVLRMRAIQERAMAQSGELTQAESGHLSLKENS